MESRCVKFGIIALILSFWSLEVQHDTSWQRTLWWSYFQQIKVFSSIKRFLLVQWNQSKIQIKQFWHFQCITNWRNIVNNGSARNTVGLVWMNYLNYYPSQSNCQNLREQFVITTKNWYRSPIFMSVKSPFFDISVVTAFLQLNIPFERLSLGTCNKSAPNSAQKTYKSKLGGYQS